jgi:regulator of protease activity HflC (stomatin/prohibitin superfamily)
LRLTHFEDERVLTRESVPLFIKIALWWRVADLSKYYYTVDKEIHVVDSDRVPVVEAVGTESASSLRAQRDAAEQWIKALAESTIRKIISTSSTAFVVSKNATSYLHIDKMHEPRLPPPQPSKTANTKSPQTATPNVLADEIYHDLDPKVHEYGLEIDRVEVQEVRLPIDLQTALNEVFMASLEPAKTEQEARAQRIRLEAAASVLGVQAVALSEALKNFHVQGYMGGMPALLDALSDRIAGSRGTPQKTLPRASADQKPAGQIIEEEEGDGEAERDATHCPKCGGRLSRVPDQPGAQTKFQCPTCGASFRLTKRSPTTG